MILLAETEALAAPIDKTPIIAIAVVAIILALIAVIVILLKKESGNRQTENICPQCGKPVKNGKNFCTNCGAKIE